MSIVYGDDKLVKGAEILELYREAGWLLQASREASEIESAVRGAAVFITARDGARLVGFASALSDRSYYAHVTEYLVRPALRERGIGNEILVRVLDALKDMRAISIFAEPDAHEFYRRLGFSPTGGGMLRRRD